MVQAIGATAPSGASGISPSAGGVLQAQLNRYEVQLADWCNCPAGKTPEGKEKIRELTSKADGVRAQLDRIGGARSSGTSLGTGSASGSGLPATEAVSEPSPRGATAPAPLQATFSTLGTYLDVFA